MPDNPLSISPSQLATEAIRLAAHTELWQALVRYDAVSRYYARLVEGGPYEAWLLTWLPGQGTEWHDHANLGRVDGSAGVFTVLRGTLTERHARPEDGGLRIASGSRLLVAGELRPFGERHVHKVSNDQLEPAVSLHLYAPALAGMNAYTPVAGRLVRSDAQRAGAHW